MKRHICIYIIVLSLSLTIFTATAQAIPTFGTLMPQKGKYLGGYRADIILNRDVKDYDNGKSNAYTYTASYGFSDWFCVDGLIGIGDVRSELINIKELRYPYNFSGGYGWRAKVYKDEKHKLDWVWGFQHVSTHPGYQVYRGRKYSIIWDEWQLSTVISKEFMDMFRPYCGLKYSFVYFIRKVQYDRHRNICTSPPMGLVLGTDVRINNYTYINVEGRLIDESAINAGITIRY